MSKIIVYSDMPEDIETDEVVKAARNCLFQDHDQNMDDNGVGIWRGPEDIPDKTVHKYIHNCFYDIQCDNCDSIKSALEGKTLIVRDDGSYHYMTGHREGGYIVTNDIFSLDMIDSSDVKIYDENGVMKMHTDDHDGYYNMRIRALTSEGEEVYSERSSKTPKKELAEKMFMSDKYSEDIPLAKLLGRENSLSYVSLIGDEGDFDEYTPIEPMSFRAESDGWVDLSAYEARTGLLSDADKDIAETMFRRDSVALGLYFGQDVHGNDERNTADMMLKIATAGADEKACTRIFKASVWGEKVSDKDAEKMAKEAVGLVKGYADKMENFRENGASGMKLGKAPVKNPHGMEK